MFRITWLQSALRKKSLSILRRHQIQFHSVWVILSRFATRNNRLEISRLGTTRALSNYIRDVITQAPKNKVYRTNTATAMATRAAAAIQSGMTSSGSRRARWAALVA